MFAICFIQRIHDKDIFFSMKFDLTFGIQMVCPSPVYSQGTIRGITISHTVFIDLALNRD